jgi:putative peptidoglycan lipid II flippase
LQRDEIRALLILIAGYAAATLTGFLRQAFLAHQLGASRAADIYLVAFALPEFVFIALPVVLSPAFLPIFASLRQRNGERMAWSFWGRSAFTLLVFLVGLSVLASFGARYYLAWLSPGFGDLERALALQAARVMLPALGIMGLATLISIALQVYRRFARPAFFTAVYNLAFVAALLALPVSEALLRAAWGVTLGALAVLLFQVTFIWLRPHRALDGLTRAAGGLLPQDQVARTARLAAWMFAGYSAHHLILFVDRAMATTQGPGSAAALHYALHLALAVGQVSGLAVSTVLFPKLAEQIDRSDLAAARRSLVAALQLVWMIALPASAGLVVLRQPVVRLLFERGAFDEVATTAVSAALAWYALAVLADALCQPLWRVLYAQYRFRTVLAVNSLQTVVRILANILLISRLGYLGLSVSAVLGLTLQACVLAWIVRGSLDLRSEPAGRRTVGVVGLASLAAVLVAGLISNQLSAASPLAILIVSGGSGALTYGAFFIIPKVGSIITVLRSN